MVIINWKCKNFNKKTTYPFWLYNVAVVPIKSGLSSLTLDVLTVILLEST